jgi:HEAT repeat protein
MRVALAALWVAALTLAIGLSARPFQEAPPAPEWVAALGSEDAEKRLDAAMRLGRHGRAAVPPLVAALRAGAPDARAAAALALGERAGDVSWRDLNAALKDVDFRVRALAAEALGRTAGGGIEVTGNLIALLKDPDWAVRNAAAEALAERGERWALLYLAFALKPEPFARTAWQSFDATRRLRLLTGAELPFNENLGTLERAAQARAWLEHVAARADVQDSLVRGLGVWKAILSDECRKAARAAGPPIAPALVKALRAGSPMAASEAAGLLIEVGTPGAAPALRDALRSGPAMLRARAARALGTCGGAADLEALGRALGDPDEDVRIGAADALGKLALPAARPVLERALASARGETRAAVERALARLRG